MKPPVILSREDAEGSQNAKVSQFEILRRASPAQDDGWGGVLLLFAILLLASACATLQPSSHPMQASVELRENPQLDSWRATIHYSRPVDGVVFDVTRDPFRASTWTIVRPENARWQEIDGRDAITFPTATDTVVLEFPSDLRPREKDYHVNVGFSDGSRLIYTGHLRTRPIFGVGTYDPREPVVHDWLFVTDAQRQIRLLDIDGRGSLRWPTRHTRWYGDTFVYFGSIEPSSTRKLLLVADPALPQWMISRMLAVTPHLFDFFAQQTGTTLEFQPLAFLSWSGSRTQGYSFAGSTLTGVVQLAVGGDGWLAQTRESEETWLREVAHEIFHLWGGQILTPDEDAEWLSEASAEYFSLLGMRSSGVMSDRAVRRAVVEAANECIARIGATSIMQSVEDRKFRNFYTCGVVTQFLADQAIARSSGRRRSIGELYERLYDQARNRTRRYRTADFTGVLAQLSTDEDANRDINRIISDGVSAPSDEFFASALQRAGVDVSRVPLSDATITPGAQRFVLAEMLQRCACRNGTEELCGGNARVTAIDGHNVGSETAAAYASLIRTTDSRAELEGGREISLACSEADLDPTFRSFLRLESRP
ncbi:MAG: hypothetical protein ACXV5L_09370 [Thermoanaerobaculia bacterium]